MKAEGKLGQQSQPVNPTAVENSQYDFHLLDGGSVFILTPLTPTGRAWIEANVDRSGFHPDWPTLVIEPRYLNDLVNGLYSDGLDVSTEVQR